MGSAVHEGVQLEFAHRGSTAAAAADGVDSAAADVDGSSSSAGSWRSGLDVLSGGQRTMVSLAFVVAVSQGVVFVGWQQGGVRCSVDSCCRQVANAGSSCIGGC